MARTKQFIIVVGSAFVGFWRSIDRGLKRMWRKGAIVLGSLLIVYLIANSILVWVTGTRLEERLSALRAAGEPVVFSDFTRPAPPADRNAATFLDRAQSDIKSISQDLIPIRSSTDYGDNKLSDADRKTLHELFDAYSKLLPFLEQAAACSEYQSSVDYSAGPNATLNTITNEAQRLRSAITILDARARLAIAEGKPDAALRDSIRMLRLSRLFEPQPVLIGQLVIIACRAVSMNSAHHALLAGPVSDQARRDLDAELAAADESRGYVLALKGERAFAIDMLRNLDGNTWFTRAYFNDEQGFTIDVIARFIDWSGRTFAEISSHEPEFRDETRSIRHSLSRLILPAYFKISEAQIRSIASVRCLRIWNALQTRSGEPAIADLGLPAAALIDPFNGQPLNAKKTARGWLVYSVGANLADDGGNFDKYLDVGYGPKALP